MPKNAWLGVLLACGVLLCAWFAVLARRSEQAEELTEQALRLLHPPLAEAASLRDIRGREARELREEAQAISHDPERSELLAWARASELYGKARYAEADKLLSEQPKLLA